MFIGVEGKSDQAFVQFLGRLCDDAGLHVHLKVNPCGGGDSLVVVEETARLLKRHPDPRGIATRLVLLDSDRIRQDREAGRDAVATARKHGLQAVTFDPNLEGMLVRLYRGHERRTVVASDAGKQLRKLWPTYSKSSLNADQLRGRFSLADLERAASYDRQLFRLLSVLGLVT